MNFQAFEDEIRKLSPGRHGEWHATWHEVFRACESPIETAMAEALRTGSVDHGFELCPAYPKASRADLAIELKALAIEPRPRLFWIMSQRRLGRYRADFVLVGHDADENLKALIVECDGVEWHSSYEQMVSDRERDKEIRAMGIEIKRFWGDEIYREGDRCADDVFAVFAGKLPSINLSDDFDELGTVRAPAEPVKRWRSY